MFNLTWFPLVANISNMTCWNVLPYIADGNVVMYSIFAIQDTQDDDDAQQRHKERRVRAVI